MATSLRHLDLATARQIIRRKGALRLHDLGRSSRRDHFPAALARARPHVDHEVGAADGILVVLDHDDGVAEVAQMLQRGDKPLVVALMQADRRFVQDIEHAHEPCADLRGKADALGLAARQRGGGALERQVVESHVHEEFQSRLDLLHDGPRDALGLARERKAVEERVGIGGRHLRHVVDGLAAHGDGEDFGLQALTVAGLARHRREILLESLALRIGLRLLVAAHNRGEHAFPLDIPVRLAAVDRDVVDAHLLLAEARHDGLLRAARHILPRRGRVNAHVRRHRLDDLRIVVPRAKRRDDALVKGKRRVRHHERGVDLVAAADSQAVGAGAVRCVEREVARLQLVHGMTMFGTGEREREEVFPCAEPTRGTA